jgi:hypothetical protein
MQFSVYIELAAGLGLKEVALEKERQAQSYSLLIFLGYTAVW